MRASVDKENRWLSVAFTWNGLRALGVDEASLATFPEEFKQGMVARAEVLGDTGENHPDHWVGGLASPDLHAVVILFARDAAEKARSAVGARKSHRAVRGRRNALVVGLGGDTAFWLRPRSLRLSRPPSQPVIEGSGDEPTPGSGTPLKPGEFILGYPDEDGPGGNLPQPAVLSRNGSFMAYRRLEEHVARFRDFLRATARRRKNRSSSRRN